MKITVHLDDEAQGHFEKIKQLKGLDTVNAVIKYALRNTANSMESYQPDSKVKALLNLRGQVQWEGDLDEMRAMEIMKIDE